MRNFEREKTGHTEYYEKRDEQQEKDIEKMSGFLGKIAERLRDRGVPVEDDCRVNVRAYECVRSNVEEDENFVREQEKEHAAGRKINEEDMKKERKKTAGEQLEMLAIVILNKILPERFVAVRSSLFDDFSAGHKVDIILLDKETGSVVCAFDGVDDAEGDTFANKEAEVIRRNKNGGAYVRYGLGMENEELVLCSQEHIPIFCLALPERSIKKGMRKIEPFFDRINDYEKEAFTLFVEEVGNQFAKLRQEKNINRIVRTNVIKFYDEVLPVLQDISYNLSAKK